MNTFIKILSFLFSLIALGLSIYAVSHEYYADIPTSILSIVGICTTLIVGISVVDAFAFHSTLHKIDKKMKELSNRMDKLTELETKIRKTRRQANILFHHTWGLIYTNNHQPCDALNEFWQAFILAAKDNDLKRAKTCLKNAEEAVEEINKPMNLGVLDGKQISITVSDELRQTDIYVAFEDRINKLVKKY